jgi:hypothetical protein
MRFHRQDAKNAKNGESFLWKGSTGFMGWDELDEWVGM